MHLGFDRTSALAATSVDRLADDGQKSRLGIKFREGALVGNIEYKFDIGDGDATNDGGEACSATLSDCRTFNLHIGNLGFETPIGYIGAGTFESPYKTFGMYDQDMDTALGWNRHGSYSTGVFGVAGSWESSLSYHAKMGPVSIAYMHAMGEKANANTESGDYSYAIKFNDLLVSGLEFGVAATHDNRVGGAANAGQGNKKVFASYKVMPGVGIFYSEEDLELETATGGAGFTNGDGEIVTIGTHVTLGNQVIQFAWTDGDTAATAEDYKTVAVSIKNNLSKNTDITYGFARKGFDAAGGSNRTYAIGLTHSF